MKMGAVKNILTKILILLRDALNASIDGINKTVTADNPNFYNDLTPIDNADDDNKYCEAILWALKNDNIKNIAITGPYGSGKSSVIRTFEKKHPEFKFLNISLGSFKEKLPETNDSLNLLIEKSILQQIFYRVKKQEIPYSRFNRIKNVTFWSYSLTSGLLTLWFIDLLFLYEHHNQRLTDSIKSSGISENTLLYIATALGLLGLFFFTQQIFKIFSHSKVNKIGLTSGQLEFNETNGDSILNKHLDEIIYFFEKTEFDVVIIEDLDRFEEVDIFIKLKEINTLLNNSDQISRKIVFLYAIKDEIFKDTNRTKFFDFIIPIIPVINSSNSGDKLNGMLEATLYSGAIPKEFVSDITLYIDDMRMLKNIYNEFVLYRNKLSAVSGIDLRNDKLLGFIVYKNKYPDDFAKLNVNKGIVASVFNNKIALIKKRTIEIEKSIEIQEKELLQVEKERSTSIKELRTIYVAGLFQSVTNLTALHLNGNRQGFSELITDEFFNQYREATQVTYYMGSNIQTTQINFKSIEDAIDPNNSYQRRETLINKKSNINIDEAKKKIEALKDEIRDIRSASLQELISKLPNEEVFEKDVLNHDLMIYLIRYGYIDEMYYSFISYFYEGNMTKNDMAFLLSVKNRNPLTFAHALVKTQAVVSKLNPADFRSVAIFNFDLVHYLLNDPKNFAYLEFILLQISNASKTSMEFLDSYLLTQESKSLFINKLCKKWRSIWKTIFSDSGYSSDKVDDYLKLMILNVDIEDLVRMDWDNLLSEYIAEKVDFLDFVSEIKDLSKLKEIISKLEIKFKRIENPENNEALFKYVYENNAYQINLKMIESIIGFHSPALLGSGALTTSNYTTILESNCSDLIDYIEENLDEYIENVFLDLENNTNESEKVVVKLLNHNQVEQENKFAILHKSEIRITKLDELDDIELWDICARTSKMAATWDNVFAYFKYKKLELSEEITEFLNESENYLSLSKVRLNSKADLIDKLCRKLILNAQISDDSYEYLIRSIPYWYSSPEFVDGVSNKKISLLLNHGKFQLSAENYKFLKTTLPEEYAILLQHNLKDYLSKIEQYELDSLGLEFLLASSQISNEQKLTILKSVVDVSILDQKPELISLAFKVILGHGKTISLSLELMEVLFKQNTISDIEKIRVFNTQVDQVDISVGKTLLSYIGAPLSGIATGQRPELDNNNTYLEFAEKLKKIGILSSFKIKDKKIRPFPKKT